MILNIRHAMREGSKVVIGICGQSGSGKTLTALKIARGMVAHAGEIGFLDTENKRGSLYADELDAPFLIGDLYPPFSPLRYAEAIKEFQAAGVKVLVIDSISHEWEGEGGCIDIAENTTGKVANWKKAKAEHKKFMNALLQADMHVIACVRAREQVDFSNPSSPKSLGVQPICEKNFMFEMTSSVMMSNEGKESRHIKVPKDLKPIFIPAQDGYMGGGVGTGIMQWIGTGVQVSPELISWQNRLQASASDGLQGLASVWAQVPKQLQKQLADHKEQCKASAMAYDEIAKEQVVMLAIVPEQAQGFNPAPPQETPAPIATKPEEVAPKSEMEDF